MNPIRLFRNVSETLQNPRRSSRPARAREFDPRPRVECLESRIAPANLVATVAGHTLNVVGTADPNALTIDGVAGDATKFQLSAGTDTVNGLATFDTPTGITSISIKLLGGDDRVTLDNTVAIDVKGSLSIDGGDGANSVTTADLTVEKDFSITNGKNPTGTDMITLINLNVKGSVKIANGDGDTIIIITRISAGLSAILGNLSITNGAGRDTNYINDENVGGSVTINNGKPDAGGIAGFTDVYNVVNTSTRSVIGGDFTVKYLSGNGFLDDDLLDTEVGGNVTFDHGAGGNFTTYFDGLITTVPVLIHGNLTVKGTGSSAVFIGILTQQTGLIVGKDLHITSGKSDDGVILNKVRVEGSVVLAAGDGANTLIATDLDVAKNLTITNGKNPTGTDSTTLGGLKVLGSVAINNGFGATATEITAIAPIGKNLSITNGAGKDTNTLTNLTVNGSVTIANGDGDTDTHIFRNTVGFSTIFGNLNITNGVGGDSNRLSDENVGGNVTISNGKASAGGVAGTTKIFNDLNTSARLVIGGGVSVTYANGSNGGDLDAILDAEIGGNVTFDHGAGGTFETRFDGFAISLPVLIHGSLTMKGSGPNTVTIGASDKFTGLIVDKNVSITTGTGADSVTLNKLLVGGNTSLLLGDGANTTKIDDSVFSGTFTLITGKDADTINLETTAGSSAPTIFGKAVLIKEGAGADHMTRAGAIDASQAIYVDSTFVIYEGGNVGDTMTSTSNTESFPFFNFIQVIG